mmetsp:Transcript_7006/g.11631  ORF Transcript_7006/g.11631 Transcript_7006/m.11631 type:complete len:537 (+) Transcript_7006:2-1612(+)
METNNDSKRTPLHFEARDQSRGTDTVVNDDDDDDDDDDVCSSSLCSSLWNTWWNESAWPGLGLFGESYLLFSLGLLKPFWAALYPDCFAYEAACSKNLLHSLTYSVVLGVIAGMLLLGYQANRIGRRRGSITTASFMAGGSIGLALSSFIFANNPSLLFQSMSALLFIFGIGVGGEYPLSSSTATEKAMGEMNKRLKNDLERDARRSNTTTIGPWNNAHPLYESEGVLQQQDHDQNDVGTKRGRAVQLVFLSQGIGIMANTLVLVFLLIVFGQYGSAIVDDGYSHEALLAIWRIVYSIGALVLTFVLVSRITYLKESDVWADDKDRREKLDRSTVVDVSDDAELDGPPAVAPALSTVSSLSAPSSVMLDDASEAPDYMYMSPESDKADASATPVRLLIRHFGMRMLGSSLSWLLWDIAFYGNKLFQSTFLLAITGANTTLLELSGFAALNAFVALLGYIGAAVLLDHPQAGRLRLQQYGFLITGALFVACGFLYDKLSSGWLVLMYFASSFVGQLGPNATTFLIPAGMCMMVALFV